MATTASANAADSAYSELALQPPPGMHDSASTKSDLMSRIAGFPAPYLETRFLQYGLAEDRASAQALFVELKRYLFLAAEAPTSLPMVSALVDAAWHQFILFTAEYRAFCDDVIGSYQHHGPRVADAAPSEPTLDPGTFFRAYRDHFGPPPDVWHNERCLRPQTRIVHPFNALFEVEIAGGSARLLRERALEKQVVCLVSARAGDALRFIATNTVFLVRELPGLRGHAEQLALISPLVEHDILHLAF